MKMRKLFAGLLATSLVAAGTSAFAATANDAGYDKTEGTYSIAADLSTYGDDQMTIIIIPEAAYNAGTINDADILYIDQAAANTTGIFANVGILGGTTLAEGKYYVKIGGENIAADGIIVETFEIKADEPEAPAIQYGNVDTTGASATVIDGSDALKVAEYVVSLTTLTEEQIAAANVDQSGASATAIDGSDALAIAEAVVSLRDAATFPIK